jgi:hypothetical protein
MVPIPANNMPLSEEIRDVTTPTLTVPLVLLICNDDVGFVVPMPRLPDDGLKVNFESDTYTSVETPDDVDNNPTYQLELDRVSFTTLNPLLFDPGSPFGP